MSRIGQIYEWVRPLIIWLGLGELAWIGFWLLSSPKHTHGVLYLALRPFPVTLDHIPILVSPWQAGFKCRIANLYLD